MAVTGERLEFRVPAGVFTALGLRDSLAVCFADAGLLARDAERRSAPKGAGKAFATLAQQIPVELARLERAGVDTSRPIPLCMFRATGKDAEQSREKRRATATHERFHADVRRAEARIGGSFDDASCRGSATAQLRTALGAPAAEALLAATLLGWKPPIEEVLARAEEVRKACLRSATDCRETRERYQAQMGALVANRRVPAAIPTDAIPALSDAVVARYGSPMGFVTQALRACAAENRRG